MRLRLGVPLMLFTALCVGVFAVQSSAFQYGRFQGYGLSSYQSNEKADIHGPVSVIAPV